MLASDFKHKQLGSCEANWVLHRAKFPKQGRGHQNDNSKPDWSAVTELGRPETKKLLADINILTLEPGTGMKCSASDFAHGDLGLLPVHPWRSPDLLKLNQG